MLSKWLTSWQIKTQETKFEVFFSAQFNRTNVEFCFVLSALDLRYFQIVSICKLCCSCRDRSDRMRGTRSTHCQSSEGTFDYFFVYFESNFVTTRHLGYICGISGYIWGTFNFANQSNLNAIDWENTPNCWEHYVFGKALISWVSIHSDNLVYQYFPNWRLVTSLCLHLNEG